MNHMFKHCVESGFLSEVGVRLFIVVPSAFAFLNWMLSLYFKDVPRGMFFHISAFTYLALFSPSSRLLSVVVRFEQSTPRSCQ